MAATVDEFIAESIVEHRSRFNQWCLLIGDVGMMSGALIAMVGAGHRLIGAQLLIAGLGIATIGHLVDRNLSRALKDSWEHPIWTLRGDLAVIRRVLDGS